MPFPSSHFARNLSILVLAGIVVLPANLFSQDTHVVSPSDLQKQAISATLVRANNIRKVREFLSSPVAEKAMRNGHMNPGQVRNAVSGLSDTELAQLAARADKAQHDFAAGYLSTLDIALIILGVALIILIIVVAT